VARRIQKIPAITLLDAENLVFAMKDAGPCKIRSDRFDRRTLEFHRAVERCPSRDDGCGEFACPLGPAVQLATRPSKRLVPPRPRIPRWKGLGADPEEKREPVSDIDTAVVDSLKALDPERPIREADITIRRAQLARSETQLNVAR
jgi:hypothetical protein